MKFKVSEKQEIMQKFITDCKLQLHLVKPIKSIYDSYGRLITSLGGIESAEKFVYICAFINSTVV